MKANRGEMTMDWRGKAKRDDPGEPEWSREAREMEYRRKYAKDFVGKFPDDSEVLEAKRRKIDLLSPSGLHWFDDEGKERTTGRAEDGFMGTFMSYVEQA